MNKFIGLRGIGSDEALMDWMLVDDNLKGVLRMQIC